MKGLYLSLCLLLTAGYSFAQSDLILSALYDGPLSGGHPKGIELYVVNNIPDLSIYGIGVANNGGGSDGQEYTFPAEAASAGSYVYLAADAQGFLDYFGFALTYEDNIMSINGDDPVELYKDGVVVDVYGDVALDGTGSPWEYLDGWASRVPGTGPDGDTFVLGHWLMSGPNALDGSTTSNGSSSPVRLMGQNSPLTPDATIEASNFAWTPADITIEQGDLVTFSNAGGFHNIDFSVATYPNNPEGSRNGDASTNPWTYSYIFYTPGVYDFQCNPHAGNGMVGTITVNTPAGPTYTPSTIAAVTTIDGVGVPDSIDATVELVGIVYGIDYSGGGSNLFTLIDNSGGISVSAVEAIGYTVQEGDELKVSGTIAINTGMTRITADIIEVVSSGNSLAAPTVVTQLDESTESEFIRLNNLTLVDASEWLGDGSSFNVNATDGTNNFLIRMDSDSEVANRPAPVGSFDMIGLGAQFDTSSPYDEGYQLFPRYNSDVIQAGALPTAADDELILSLNETGSVNVIANDFLSGDFGQITLLDNITFGVVSSADSTVSFAPFQDECGMESVRYEVCNTTGLCDTANVNITVVCPPMYPAYDIAVLTTNDGVGRPDSFDVDCAVTGIVYGINLRPAGTQFTIIDENNADAGIGVFLLSDDLGYTVTEGDKVTVQGQVDFFNGLTQMNPEAIEVISTGNSLHSAAVVTALDESTESKLVKINNLMLVDPTQWDDTGGSFNADVTDGTNTFVMRVDSDTDIAGTTIPPGVFTVTGIGGQWDEETPWDEGYQIQPRYLSDIDFDLSAEWIEDFEELIYLYPNPTKSTVNIATYLNWESIEIYNMLGHLIRSEVGPKNQISVEGLSSGVYHLVFRTESGVGVKKLQVIK